MPKKSVLHEHHCVAQAGSADRRSCRVEMIRDHGNENGQIEVRMKAPGEIEIALMRERRARCRRDIARRCSIHLPASVDHRVVGDECAARKQRWSSFRSSALCFGRAYETKQQHERKRRNGEAETSHESVPFPENTNTHCREAGE